MNIKYTILAMALLMQVFQAFGQYRIEGRVISKKDGAPVSSAWIQAIDKKYSTQTDADGNFKLLLPSGNYSLLVKHLAYQDYRLDLKVNNAVNNITINLNEKENSLATVEVNTGYQVLPKERATGSFDLINRNLINQTTGLSIIDRLQNNVTGLSFNKVGLIGGNLNISIRGQSTINANKEPLIVLDNFPYDGDILSINPEDIESITILKDAAAASIWGARAGNGVIVLTSKQGKLNQAVQINVNNSIRFGEKPNLFFESKLSTSEYIDIQQKLFDKGYYTSLEQNDIKNISHGAVPELIEILIAKRDGKIDALNATNQIDALRKLDIRNDIDRYLNQVAVNQQYAINVNGGSALHKYYISGGYDQNRANQKGNSINRLSLQANQSFLFFNNKLKLAANLFYTQQTSVFNAESIGNVAPYSRLADENGNHLVMPALRNRFVDESQQKGLLNWQYRPLDELNFNDKQNKSQNLRLNLNLGYTILNGLIADFMYQYGQVNGSGKEYYSTESYFTRNLINGYTQINPDGTFTLPIPIAGILDLDNSNSINHNLRGQLTFEKFLGSKHQINALAGYELKQLDNLSRGYRLYGYDNEHATSAVVDYVTDFIKYDIPGLRSKIANGDTNSETADRARSFYANAVYNYDTKYMLSASARLDQSNIFGVNTNQKGVPLYSLGASWIASNESFFKMKFMDMLKLRLTYGYSGNVDRSISAYTTALYISASSNANNAITKQPYAQVQNPPNPELRWEKIRMINLGVDFSIFNKRINGSIDTYLKKGIDLIGSLPFPPSSGITSFKGNYANTIGNGVDVTLQTVNLKGALKWTSSLLFAYVSDKVTGYKTKGTVINYLNANGYPLEGKPLYSVYSYHWAGLDAKTGDPMGYLDGLPSTDYSKILASYTPEKLEYHGSGKPTHFGSLRNTFAYKQISLSFNISYKFNYYFKRSSIVYGTTFGLDNAHGDYSRRWQQPGDELYTQVPSVPLTSNTNRDNFYVLSGAVVERGDHIRFEEINLTYHPFSIAKKRKTINQLEFFTVLSNVGIIYKKTREDIDPDYLYNSYGPSKTLAMGFRLNFN